MQQYSPCLRYCVGAALISRVHLGEDAIMDYDDEIFMEEDEDEEDPNDPEWTDVEKSNQKDRHHRR